MILGTAGHVDHGKTALVRALTGIDTDRLSEEKRRGITIDLGFAPLHLHDGTTLGVVDVPGHEAFVRNMLAGATGVDLALLVIAADEGVMPQTREHLAILSLLGIRGGVVVLTKTDLVDAEWLDLVTEDVCAALAGSPLQGAALVRTSVVSGDGLADLRAAIASAARAVPLRDAGDLFRLPVDRAFTVRGTGTVVTGTVWSGTLARDATVRLLPSGAAARVRGIEEHGQPVPYARPGTRAAIALAGVDVDAVPRGTVIVQDAGWAPSTMLLADVALLDDAPAALGPRSQVRFHLGTSDVGARVVAAGGALAPHTRRAARIVLAAPVVARGGDRFVLRGGAPQTTIGGGIVRDPAPPHRRARPAAPAAGAMDPLPVLLAASGPAGLDIASLPVRTGLTPSELEQRLAHTPAGARRVGRRLYLAGVVVDLAERLRSAVDDFHARQPLEPGAPLQSIRAGLAADAALVDELLRDLQASGAVELAGGLIRRGGWSPTPSPEQTRRAAELARTIDDAGREPPSVTELRASQGEDTPALLRYLERGGRIVQVEPERYYGSGALAGMLDALRTGMAAGGELGPAELRDILGFSRKFLIPFLEYCDRIGITERRGAARVLRA